MSSSNKNWLKVASIISWIYASGMILVGLTVIFNIFDMSEVLEWYVSMQVNDHANPHEYSFVKFLVMAESLFACGINTYAGVLFWSLAKKNHVVAGASRILSTTGIFQLLFTANAFSAIVAFCVASSLNKTVWKKREQNNLEYIAYEIEKIRVLKDKGVITEEEWQTQLNNLLTQYTKEKDTKK